MVNLHRFGTDDVQSPSLNSRHIEVERVLDVLGVFHGLGVPVLYRRYAAQVTHSFVDGSALKPGTQAEETAEAL